MLFSNLETGDAAKISEKLTEKRVPFQLKDGGRAILVPDDKVYQLRLELASDGIPTGSSVGFEIFNNISFGTTDFVQKLKFQQALQGELARTIMQFDSIDQARVHIVPAGDSLFAEAERPATASVVVRPNAGRNLNQAQLQGIINLVACAVEGLQPDNVTVVDMAGGMLSKGQDENSISNVSQTQFDYQRKLESTYEKRIQTMLEPVIGINKVVARVSADLDFRRVNISEEKYDPDSVVVRSEQKQTESSTDGNGQVSGSPDLKYQVYQDDTGNSSSSSKRFEKANSVINYEINRVNTQIIDSTSDIKRLSASVIIDGPYAPLVITCLISYVCKHSINYLFNFMNYFIGNLTKVRDPHNDLTLNLFRQKHHYVCCCLILHVYQDQGNSLGVFIHQKVCKYLRIHGTQLFK